MLSQLPCSWEPSHSQMDKTPLQGGTAAPSGFPTASLGGTQDTYQYPASHFVLLRATSGLNCQIFPVTRQQLHSLDTMLSPNDLKTEMFEGLGAYGRICYDHTCTQTRSTLVLYEYISCSSSVFLSLTREQQCSLRVRDSLVLGI